MLPTYPIGQIIPGQHPKYPQFWKFSSVQEVEKALEHAEDLTKNNQILLIDSFADDIHINLLRDTHVHNALKVLLYNDYEVQIFSNDTWIPWIGEPVSCVEAIRIAK